MANARFLLTNLASTATVKNGTGGSPTPPARTEISPFTMERALNDDRRSLWKLDAPNDVIFGGSYQLDLDLGSSKAVTCMGLHGLSCPGGEITSISFGSMNSYPTSSYSELGFASGAGVLARDVVVTFPSTAKRYWYFWVEATASPVIGKVSLGTHLDIGAAPNFGSEFAPFGNRIEQTLEDGSVLVNELGDDGGDFSLSFQPVENIVLANLNLVQQTRGTVVYIDPDDNGYEVFLKGRRLRIARLGGGLYSAGLDLGRCP